MSMLVCRKDEPRGKQRLKIKNLCIQYLGMCLHLVVPPGPLT